MSALATARGTVLLELARQSIVEAFGGPSPQLPEGASWLVEKRAVFVTLTRRGELRGCVGQLEARLSLFEAVCDAAKAAAFHDTRFEPLRKDELKDLHVEISVLSPMEPLESGSEQQVLAQVRQGTDGLVLAWGGHRGVFIPEVWKQVATKEEFLHHLKLKAGLRPDRWYEGTRIDRFTADVYEDCTPRA